MSTRSGPGGARRDLGLDAVRSERRQLINLAYRLLGSLADAEDAVQETYARWYGLSAQQREAIENPAAWLTTVASRICLDLLGSARARRERYVGEWIPEPLPDPGEWPAGRPGATADPADRVTLDESVSMAFLVVLESMTPAERRRPDQAHLGHTQPRQTPGLDEALRRAPAPSGPLPAPMPRANTMPGTEIRNSIVRVPAPTGVGS